MKKPVMAMLVVAAIAIGLLIVLALGIGRVEEDGRQSDSAGPAWHQTVVRPTGPSPTP